MFVHVFDSDTEGDLKKKDNLVKVVIMLHVLCVKKVCREN